MSLRLALVVVAAATSLVRAQPAPARVVALAPLSTLGAEDTSATSKKLTQQIEAGLATLPNTKVVTAAAVVQAITKAKKPQLKICERDPGCLAELGKLVGATHVIDGEVGGLGESKVVYLGAVDVASAKELRSTTLQVGNKADPEGGAAGAAVRLLDPERFKGTLRFTIDATGATVYVNGSRTTLGPKGEVLLLVGTQAVRVTHPQYQDFVKFIEVQYNKSVEVPVAMTKYTKIQHDIEGKPIGTDQIVYIDPPWYRRPLFVSGIAVVLAVGVGVLAASLAHDFPDGECRRVGGAKC